MAYARVSTKAQSLERQKASIYEVIPDLKDYVYWKWLKQFYPEYQQNKHKVKQATT